eukprot:jgi/Botrbrau1/15707/Bobra.4_1s0080.1
MASVEPEAVCRILDCISSSSNAREGASVDNDGCYGGPPRRVSVSELECIVSLSDEQSDEVWTTLEEQGIALSSLARAFQQLMNVGGNYSLVAASAYIRLVALKGCQVLGMFDCLTSTTFLNVIKEACTPGRALAHSPHSDTEDIDMETPSHTDSCKEMPMECQMLFKNLSIVLDILSLKDQQETLKATAQTLVHVLGSRFVTDEGAQAAGLPLKGLLKPQHGPLKETAAFILRNLIPTLLQQDTEKKPSNETKIARTHDAVWTRALEFVLEVMREFPESKDVVKALVRNILLRAPDKADARHLASSTAVQLTLQMQSYDQHYTVIFCGRLSRATKVLHRSLSVDLATDLLSSLPDPFAPTSIIQPHMSADAIPAKDDSLSATPASASLGQQQTTCHTLDPSSRVINSESPAPILPPNCQLATWGNVCLAVLVHRISDKAAAVRSKAITSLAGIISDWSSSDQDYETMTQFREALALAHQVQMPRQLSNTPAIISPPFISPACQDEPGGSPMLDDTLSGSPIPLTGNTVSNAPFVQKKLAGSMHRNAIRNAAARARTLQVEDLELHHLTRLARRRMQDEKATVRKAAVSLLEALMVLQGKGHRANCLEDICGTDLKAIGHAAMDPLVSVRRASLSAMSHLLKEFPQSQSLARLWIEAALPLVRDVEAAIQESLLDQFNEHVIAPATKFGSSLGRGIQNWPPPQLMGLLPILTAMGNIAAAERTCLGRACALLSAKHRLPGKNVIAALQEIVKNSDGEDGSARYLVQGCWVLLAEISTHQPAAPSWSFLKAAWQGLNAEQAPTKAEGVGLLLQVVANAASCFPRDEAVALSEELFKAVHDFTLEPTAASAHLVALSQLTAGLVTKVDKGAALQHKTITSWASIVLQNAEEQLAAYVENCGNAALLPCKMTNRQTNRIATILFTIGEVVLLRGATASQRLTTLVQALTAGNMAAHVPGGGHAVPMHVQGHAWVTLGKLCLIDETLAKKCVPILVQELGRSVSPVVRNNVMVALSDLCMQWTALVDAHIPRLAHCMADPNEIVRRQGLALLANLLLKDYVRWRGTLFHHFLVALVDESSEVKGLAEFLLNDTLVTKAPLLAYNYFVECLFTLNAYQPANSIAAAACGDHSELSHELSHSQNVPSLNGDNPSHRAKRETIYKALLHKLAPEHKFATAAKLCGEVLAGFAEGTYALSEAPEVLRDALCILSWPEIKVNVSRSTAGDDDESSTQAAVAGAAKGRLISAMMKKHLIEGMIPVLVELKRLLEAQKHPLLGLLFITLRALLLEHSAKLEDILVGDKQLAREILHDIKQAEHEQNLRKASIPVAQDNMQPSPQSFARMSNRHHSRCPGPSRFSELHQSGNYPQGTLPETPRAREVLCRPQAYPRSGSCRTPAAPHPSRMTPAPIPLGASDGLLSLPSSNACLPIGASEPAASANIQCATPGFRACDRHASNGHASTPVTVPHLRRAKKCQQPLVDHDISVHSQSIGNVDSDLHAASDKPIVLPSPVRHMGHIPTSCGQENLQTRQLSNRECRGVGSTSLPSLAHKTPLSSKKRKARV